MCLLFIQTKKYTFLEKVTIKLHDAIEISTNFLLTSIKGMNLFSKIFCGKNEYHCSAEITSYDR